MYAGYQREIWEKGVGNDWLKRNKADLGKRDLASDALKALRFTPEAIFEVGASNGWRLHKLREHYGCTVRGIDPADDAIAEAASNGIQVDKGFAHHLPYEDETFDVVIFGFCLCFISPEDWSGLVYHSNRILRDGGVIVVYDFVGTSFIKRRLEKVTADSSLEEKPLYLYNYNWPTLWLSYPFYKTAVELFDMTKAEVCTIMQKRLGPMIDDGVPTLRKSV